MSLNKEDTETVTRMEKYGGDFISTLARAMVETDQGHYFAKQLLEVRARADSENRACLMQAIPNLWGVFAWSPEQRLNALKAAYPEHFETYGPTGQFAKTKEAEA